jgi:hypothetical protein
MGLGSGAANKKPRPRCNADGEDDPKRQVHSKMKKPPRIAGNGDTARTRAQSKPARLRREPAARKPQTVTRRNSAVSKKSASAKRTGKTAQAITPASKKITVKVRVPTPMCDAVDRVAASLGITSTEFVQLAIREKLALGKTLKYDRLVDAFDEYPDWDSIAKLDAIQERYNVPVETQVRAAVAAWLECVKEMERTSRDEQTLKEHLRERCAALGGGDFEFFANKAAREKFVPLRSLELLADLMQRIKRSEVEPAVELARGLAWLVEDRPGLREEAAALRAFVDNFDVCASSLSLNHGK